MRLRGFKIHIALLVFVVVFALGLGAQYLHQRMQVIDPLVQRIQDVPGVLDVSIEKGMFNTGAETLVTLQLEEDTSLGLVFGQVYQTLTAAGGDYAVFIQDSPSKELIDLYLDIQIKVEEAVMTGEFTVLEERVKGLANAAGVTWELGVDREFVYLALGVADSTLKRVISRDLNEGRISIVNKGGTDS